MTEKSSRRNDVLAGILAPKILEISRERLEGDYGIISLRSAKMSRDGAILTCYVASERENEACAKEFRTFEAEVRAFLRDAHILRTLPRVHFRTPEKNDQETITNLIHELSQKYELSR